MNKEPKHIILHEPNHKEELEKYFKDTCESLEKEGLKQLPSHYMYDEEGSRLVAKVNETQEYYLWRCERELLENHSQDFLKAMADRGSEGERFNIVDLGAGDGSKTKVILENAIASGYNFQYIPLDISHDSNLTLCKNLSDISPKMDLTVLTSTFEQGMDWLKENKKERNLFMFMGGTIGSWDEPQLVELVQFYGKNLKKGDVMAVAFDKVKRPYLLQTAYSNKNGYEDALILNTLTRINKQLDANLDPSNFYPHAYYDPITRYVYISIISSCNQTFKIRDREFTLKECDVLRIHRSRKWTLSDAETLFEKGDFQKIALFQDKKEYFFYILFERK